MNLSEFYTFCILILYLDIGFNNLIIVTLPELFHVDNNNLWQTLQCLKVIILLILEFKGNLLDIAFITNKVLVSYQVSKTVSLK